MQVPISRWILQFSDGQEVEFVLAPEAPAENGPDDLHYRAPKLIYDTLTQVTNGYTLTTKHGIVRAFGAFGELTSISDRNGNTTHFGYTDVSATISPFVKADRTIIVDNFDNGDINWNSLNLWTDDGDSLASETLINGAIQLEWNSPNSGWITELKQDSLSTDLSSLYTHDG